jgi:dTDP-glucose pyrophosphorylase
VGVEDEYNWVAGYEVRDPSRYGVFVTKDDYLVRIHEKPKEFVGNIINTGLYKFTPEIFEKIKQINISSRGEYEIVDAITLLATEGKVKVKKIQDYWIDFGCLEDIPKVEEFLKEKVTT